MSVVGVFEEESIVVGDKVDIVTQTGSVHRTMIEDRFNEGPFLAGIPYAKGLYMHVEQDDDIYLVFYRDSGRYIAQMKVVALETRNEIRYMWLYQKTQAQKNQRRNAFRLPVSFDVQIYEYSSDLGQGLTLQDDAKAIALEKVSSRDISVTGIALQTKKKYVLDDAYILSLHLSNAPITARVRVPSPIEAPTLHLTATVKRCIPWRTGDTYNTGMHFIGISESISDGIARYVLNEQQRQLQRRNRYF